MSVSINGTSGLLDRCNEFFAYKDGNLVWKKNKYCAKIGDIAGSSIGKYLAVKLDGKNYLVARIIFLMKHGYLPKCVDHIDGNTFNNNIENLRAATPCQNNHNRSISSRNKTGVKGVSFCKQMKKYKTQITLAYKQKHLGYFDDLELAGLVADEARSLYHGSFAFNGVR